MKKAGKYALIALAILALAVLVAVYVANSRYQFLFAGPKVSHETLLKPNARVRAVVQPPLAKPLVLKVLGAGAPPPWILDRAMPYEAALFAAPDIAAGQIDVTLFLNPQRFAPIVADTLNAYSVPQKAPYVTWTSPTFDTSKRGVLSLEGFMPIDSATVDAVKEQWGVVQVPSPPPFEGNHLAEITVDNRDGSVYTLVSTFANAHLMTPPMPLESLRKLVAPIATMSVTADLAGDNDMNIHLVVECQPTAEEGEVTGVNFALGGIAGELSKAVAQRGATLTSEKRADGYTITADYSLKNVSALLQ